MSQCEVQTVTIDRSASQEPGALLVLLRIEGDDAAGTAGAGARVRTPEPSAARRTARRRRGVERVQALEVAARGLRHGDDIDRRRSAPRERSMTGVEVMPISGVTCEQPRVSLGVSPAPSSDACQSGARGGVEARRR